MSRLEFSDGTIVDTDFCYPLGQQLNLTLYGVSLASAAALLADAPERTGRIIFAGENGYRLSHEGYTALVSLSQESDHLRAILQKGA